MLTDRAFAKINLTLRVLGRRADGYHLLDSLVAFAGDVYDELSLTPGPALTLTIDGPTADAAGDAADNLVLKAARALAERRSGLTLGAFHLAKRIPVAAGLGGGSADAAAALRLLAGVNDLSLDDSAIAEAARSIGADVPVCVASRPRRMRGIGDELGPPLAMPALPALLVNPGAPCPTGAVFARLGRKPGVAPTAPDDSPPPPEAGALIDWIAARGNDLEAAAIATAPDIADVLASLRRTPACRVARMSGSGSTCFALYDDRRALDAAARMMTTMRPDWWIAPTFVG